MSETPASINFASSYFERHSFGGRLISIPPKLDLNLVVIIPAYRESGLVSVIESLLQCKPLYGSMECLVLINASEVSEVEIHRENMAIYENMQTLVSKYHDHPFWRLHVILDNRLPKKHAGVGLARKILMDEAVRRFAALDFADGIIVSFDADTYCASNLVHEVQLFYQTNADILAANHRFEHPVEGDEFEPVIYEAIKSYELYLRYFREALKLSGFPYYNFTVGSSFSVRAKAYISVGGMNRRKAGEDFYFLHKLMPTGKFGFITKALVYPSPRISDRVPFGTGKAIQQFVTEGKIMVYPLASFLVLQSFFNRLENLYELDVSFVDGFMQDQPDLIRSFLAEIEFRDILIEIKANSASFGAFRKRFFQSFNGLMVLRFLNYASVGYIDSIDVLSASKYLLDYLNLPYETPDLKEILLVFRNIQRV